MSNPSLRELEAQHKLLLSDPASYVALKTDEIRRNPQDSHAYFGRHQGRLRLGQIDDALSDINTAIALREDPVAYLCRGEIYCQLGRYRSALEDFDYAEQLDPSGWADLWGPLYQADCHSRLGNEPEALAACARLADDHWTPGLVGTPAGNKAEVIAEVQRRLAEGRAQSRDERM
jgi:tetratricopeptide (TPR) repeat protein